MGICCFVAALEVVFADGRVLRTGTRTVEGVSGYDLTRLFVGSEGTLGWSPRSRSRLVPAPDPAATVVVSFADPAAAGTTSIQRELRWTFDPRAVLNPGVVL
ncbi:FAD-binding oxidoreductase [Nocardia grenadensis]|uniref:FAD-binding oxidoreductase n=1 Tax=Nocardia grenadensis TaxID=931537 RepID=UPI0007A3AABB|nr:hypothetical protein [Nocardia grenadensis]